MSKSPARKPAAKKTTTKKMAAKSATKKAVATSKPAAKKPAGKKAAPQKVKLYHNPRCSKCRETLALLEKKKIEPEIVKYLDTPPSKTALKKILKMLGMKPRELMRTKDKLYKELGLDDEKLKVDELVDAMVTNPKLIERPIVVVDGEKAALGRPPEDVLKVL